MRRHRTIWIMYALVILIVFYCSSCATVKKKYQPSTAKVERSIDNEKQKTMVTMHVWILIMSGFVYHVLNEDQ